MVTAYNKIKAILQAISSDTLPLKFEYLNSNPAKFPAACLLSLGATEKMVDTITNQLTESFVIRIMYPAQESEDGYMKWMTMIDTLGTELRKEENQTLDGEAVNFMIRQIPPPTASNDYGQPIMLFDIIVDANVLKYIN